MQQVLTRFYRSGYAKFPELYQEILYSSIAEIEDYARANFRVGIQISQEEDIKSINPDLIIVKPEFLLRSNSIIAYALSCEVAKLLKAHDIEMWAIGCLRYHKYDLLSPYTYRMEELTKRFFPCEQERAKLIARTDKIFLDSMRQDEVRSEKLAI